MPGIRTLLEVHRLAPNVPIGYLLSFNAREPSRLHVNFLAYNNPDSNTVSSAGHIVEASRSMPGRLTVLTRWSAYSTLALTVSSPTNPRSRASPSTNIAAVPWRSVPSTELSRGCKEGRADPFCLLLKAANF